MFSTLTGLLDLEGGAVLDLYAGSGAVGLEALSRGAGTATFVECDAQAARIISANAQSMGLAGADVRCETVQRFSGRSGHGPAYDLVFADPPYEQGAADLAGHLVALAAGRIAPGAVVVVERSSRDPQWSWPPPFEGLRVRRYGAATLWYGRRP